MAQTTFKAVIKFCTTKKLFRINLIPMASIEEQVHCVFWLTELKSTTALQTKFRIEYNKEYSQRNTIVKWINKFKERGSVHDKPRLEGHYINFGNFKLTNVSALLVS